MTAITRALGLGLGLGLLIGVPAVGAAPICTGVSEANNTALSAVTVASGLTGRPLFVTAPPGDTSRIFIVEQNGFIRIKNKGDAANVTSLYLDIDLRVDSTGDEMGLLGLAFDPDFATNGRFYVNYTETAAGIRYTVIARFTALDATHGDPNSELRLMRYVQPESNHNGGWMAFGPDGYLYIATGDGGGIGDAHGTCGNGQSLTTLLGKMLRIDPRGISPASRPPDCGLGGQGYGVPEANPFDDGAGGSCDEIYTYGLRNPWRMSFDALSGDLYIGDVGQGCWEEINYVKAPGDGGYNFGWRQMEGAHCYNPAQGCGATSAAGCTPACGDGSLTAPILDYSNSGQPECAITGGYVYRGCRMPGIRGKYFYSDYCTRFIRSFTVVSGTPQNPQTWTGLDPGGTPGGLTSYGEDAQGELYLTYRNGTVRKLVPPIGNVELSGRGATPLLLDRTGAWSWEDLFRASDLAVSFYRVYRANAPTGPFNCVFRTATSTPSWPGGGDLTDPAPEQVFYYVVTAVGPAGETLTGHAGTFDASTCP